MAIARGAGTEIIRTHLFENCQDAATDLIVGVQHHIYTVLSISIYGNGVAVATDYIDLYLRGYNIKGGTTDCIIRLMKQVIPYAETFVWNDKFSFNGVEPTDFTAGLDATKQDALADQAQDTAQKLQMTCNNSSNSYDVVVTFIDQNNA